MAAGIITGFADNDDISYCPKCGEKIYTFCGDGSAKCECGYWFYVIEKDEGVSAGE